MSCSDGFLNEETLLKLMNPVKCVLLFSYMGKLSRLSYMLCHIQCVCFLLSNDMCKRSCLSYIVCHSQPVCVAGLCYLFVLPVCVTCLSLLSYNKN